MQVERTVTAHDFVMIFFVLGLLAFGAAIGIVVAGAILSIKH
jgi:hypothetical protein